MTGRERIYDEILVVRSQEGDASAFEELVERFQERLWRHAWRLLGDEEAAWDVSQEAWIGINRNLKRLEDAAAFGGWAYRIVSNKSKDWIRRERRRRNVDGAYTETDQRDQHDRQLTGERYADLREAMKHLPGTDRAMLSLRYEEEFNTAEIAEILSIPAGTVKSRLHNARNRLRAMVKEMEDE